MLNKYTLHGCKKGVRPIRSSPTHVRPKSLISAEAKKLSIKDVLNYLNDTQQFIAYFHKYDWLCHLATFIPSDKANHTCENML